MWDRLVAAKYGSTIPGLTGPPALYAMRAEQQAAEGGAPLDLGLVRQLRRQQQSLHAQGEQGRRIASALARAYAEWQGGSLGVTGASPKPLIKGRRSPLDD